jgi:recombination protein RecA
MSQQDRRQAVAAGLGRMGPPARVAAISSGSISLDWVLGGGFPRGRIAELYGPEDCGKTTIALHAVAEAQKAGGTAAFLDADHALDTAYARAIGVALDGLLLVCPECGEEALAIAATLAASRAVDLLVVDSAAALVPRLELEGGASAGMQGRMLEQGLRRLSAAAARTGCCILAVNQLRGRPGIGGPETTAGGRALRLYAAVRAEVRPIASRGPEGMRVRVRTVKNRMAPPYREAAFDIRYGEGIARREDLMACAARCGVEGPPETLETATRRALGLEHPG